MFRYSKCCQCDFCGKWIDSSDRKDYIVTLTLEDNYDGKDVLKICPDCKEKVYDIYYH